MIRVGFGRMWNGFSLGYTGLLPILADCGFDVAVSDSPDYLFFTYPDGQSDTFPGVRIFYTGENQRPDMSRCDWAFSSDFLDHERHYRLPFYRLRHRPEALVKGLNPPPALDFLLDRKFCNFVYSNTHAPDRVRFFEMLGGYKPVDAGGRVCNNIGGRVGDKYEFISRYKFTIAFENASYPGYTTEKIADPMVVHSLPIYWGNPLVDRDFNPASFVNVTSFEEGVDTVVALDQDDDAYLEMMAQPWFHDDVPNEFVAPENVRSAFERVFAWSR